MKIYQEVNLDVDPSQIAQIICNEWADEDVVVFLNELGKHKQDINELFEAAFNYVKDYDDTDVDIKLNKNGKEALDIIKKFM